jgi:hypothetical protein
VRLEAAEMIEAGASDREVARISDLVKRSLSELTALVKTRLRLMQYRPGLLAAFLARSRLGESASVDP